MSLGKSIRDLGDFLDACERAGAVTDVELVDGSGAGSGSPLSADIALEVRPEAAMALRESDVDSDGCLSLTFESESAVVPSADRAVDVDVTSAAIGEDGAVELVLSAVPAIENGDGPRADTERGAEVDGGRAAAGHRRDPPPFRDPDFLEEVYASCETFAEMADAIGMDVTDETVRRYMIDHGIHEPDSYDSDQESETESMPSDSDGAANGHNGTHEEVTGTERDESSGSSNEEIEQIALTNGLTLPDGVTVEALVQSVHRANTLFEVKHDLGIERQRALELLQDLDMVDLVVGRLDAQSERDVSREEVIERLRDASASRSDPGVAVQSPN